jgi:hypothetical protein
VARPAGLTRGRAGGGVAHPPAERVRAEEQQARARVPGAGEGVLLALGPVLRVPEVDQPAMPPQLRGVAVNRLARGVRHRIPVALEEAHHRDVAVEELPGSGDAVVRTVVGDRDTLFGAGHHDSVPTSGVQAVATPAVVRLVGRCWELGQQRPRVGRLHDEQAVAPPLARRELGDVDAAGQRRRDHEAERRMPVALGQAGLWPVRARWLGDGRQAAACEHFAPAGAPVPAHPVDADLDAPRARRAHVDPLGLARAKRLLGDIADHRPIGEPADVRRRARQSPRCRAGMRVLLGDRRLGAGGRHQPAIGPGCDASTARRPGRRVRVSAATTPGSNGREQHHNDRGRNAIRREVGRGHGFLELFVMGPPGLEPGTNRL